MFVFDFQNGALVIKVCFVWNFISVFVDCRKFLVLKLVVQISSSMQGTLLQHSWQKSARWYLKVTYSGEKENIFASSYFQSPCFHWKELLCFWQVKYWYKHAKSRETFWRKKKAVDRINFKVPGKFGETVKLTKMSSTYCENWISFTVTVKWLTDLRKLTFLLTYS